MTREEAHSTNNIFWIAEYATIDALCLWKIVGENVTFRHKFLCYFRLFWRTALIKLAYYFWVYLRKLKKCLLWFGMRKRESFDSNIKSQQSGFNGTCIHNTSFDEKQLDEAHRRQWNATKLPSERSAL